MSRRGWVKDGLYCEPRGSGRAERAAYLRELRALIARRRRGSAAVRARGFAADFSSPAAYGRSAARLRRRYRAMLGWPLTEDRRKWGSPQATLRPVATDVLGSISRARIAVLPGLHIRGLFFVPPRLTPAPLVVCQHGGLGTPEVIAGFCHSENYHNMLRRILMRGVAVFAPQFLLWREQFGPKFDRRQIDNQLKQLGGSIAALEIFALQRALDYLVTRPEVDPRRIGMAGLSYGGFYTQYAAAAEPRIKAALSSCFFNDRQRYENPDWTWFGASRSFLDAEVAALVCPRAQYIEVGRHDDHFDASKASGEARKVRRVYARLGLAHRFRFRVFEGKHEFCRDDDGIDFLMAHLR